MKINKAVRTALILMVSTSFLLPDFQYLMRERYLRKKKNRLQRRTHMQFHNLEMDSPEAMNQAIPVQNIFSEKQLTPQYGQIFSSSILKLPSSRSNRMNYQKIIYK